MSNLSLKDFEVVDHYPIYIPTEIEEKMASFINTRFSAMQQARASIDNDWDIYQTMIDAVLKPYGDDRSKSTVPLASAMIELYVAEALKIPTEFIFKGETADYSTQAKALEYVRKYDRRKQNRKNEIVENEYTTAAFWHSVIFTGFNACTYTQYDFEMDDNFKTVWTEKKLKDEKILLENIDPRLFYLDNQCVRGIDDANDCILREWMWYEQFKEYENNDLYKNIKYVAPKGYTTERLVYTVQEERNRTGDFVEIRKYWNVAKDMYIEMANWIIIREQHIMSTIDGRKALPFTIRVFWKKNNTYTGRWLCEALLMFNSELNDLRELLMDWIRRSNSPTIAIGNDLQFDGRKFAFKNEILTFDGKLWDNFQQLTGTPPNQAIFSYLERIYKDIAMFTGIDIQNILWVPQQTAYQTNVQVEASQKRVNVRLTNRDLAFERLANLHKDNLQTFFPRKDSEGLYPSIQIEDEELAGVAGEQRFIPRKWEKSIFQVTPELLRWDIYIDVFTNTNRPASNVADRQSKLEFSQSLWKIIQNLQLAQQLWVEIDIKKMVSWLMEDFNMQDLMSTPHQELAKQGADFIKKLSGMMSSVPWQQPWAPEQPQQPQQAPSTQPLSPNMQQWF